MAGFASTLRELQHVPDQVPRMAPYCDRNLGRIATSSSLVERQQLGSSCARQPPKLGDSCTVQPQPASEREVQHNHMSCTRSMLFGGSLVPNEEPMPRLTQLSGSCRVPSCRQKGFQDNYAGCTRLAVLQAGTGCSAVRNKGLMPQLGSSGSVPACGEQDVLRTDVDEYPFHARLSTPQQAVGSSVFSSHPQTWPLLADSQVSKLGRCTGPAGAGENMLCRSASDGLRRPRLLLTQSSLRPVEDGLSTTEPRSSTGSDAFSEFLEGDPWEGCEELASQGLAEWYTDFLVNRTSQQEFERTFIC